MLYCLRPKYSRRAGCCRSHAGLVQWIVAWTMRPNNDCRAAVERKPAVGAVASWGRVSDCLRRLGYRRPSLPTRGQVNGRRYPVDLRAATPPSLRTCWVSRGNSSSCRRNVMPKPDQTPHRAIRVACSNRETTHAAARAGDRGAGVRRHQSGGGGEMGDRVSRHHQVERLRADRRYGERQSCMATGFSVHHGEQAASVPNQTFVIVTNLRSAPLLPLFSACRPLKTPPTDVDELLSRHTRALSG